MQEIVSPLLEALQAGQPVAYCRLVETRGSTPQKAGAIMLVYADGTQGGTLGGGCVEAEVKQRALLALQNQTAQIETFHLTSDYGWDDGLICGGRMQVLIYPITNPTAVNYFQIWSQAVRQGSGLTEAVVYDFTQQPNSTPGLLLFDHQGEPLAGLPTLEPAWQATAVAALRPLHDRPRPYCASGIAYLPVLRRCRLVIVGGGHVGQAVARWAHDLDFDVCVMDDRPEFVSEARFPDSQQRLHGDLQTILTNLEVTRDTYCLIVTRGHHHDERALACLVNRGAAYVGMIGSRRKIKLIFEDLVAAGVAPEALRKVHAPVGIEIGSQTVAEIALSICAEVVAFRNCQGSVPGRPTPVEI